MILPKTAAGRFQLVQSLLDDVPYQDENGDWHYPTPLITKKQALELLNLPTRESTDETKH